MKTYRSVKGFTGWGQLGILVLFIGVGLILAGIAQVVIGLTLINKSVHIQQMGDAMLKALLKPENNFYLQLSQAIATFFLMFLPAMLYKLICHGRNMLWLGFSRRLNAAQLLLVFLIILFANFIAGPMADLSRQAIGHLPLHIQQWAQRLEDTYNEQALAISNIQNTWAAFFSALLIMAFLPAMFEEMLFRGALQNLLVRWWKRPVAAIIFTALVFSFIHGTVYSFLSRAILGFALGWIFYRGGNLWLNIAAHFFNNAVAVIQLFWMARSHQQPDVTKMDGTMPLWFAMASLVILYGLFMLFKKLSAANKAKIETDEQQLWAGAAAQYPFSANNPPIQE